MHFSRYRDDVFVALQSTEKTHDLVQKV